MNSATTVPGSSCNKGLLEEQRSLTQRTFWFLEFQIPWNSPEAATDMHLVEASRFVRIRPFRLSYDPFRHFFSWLFFFLARCVEGVAAVRTLQRRKEHCNDGGRRTSGEKRKKTLAFALSSPVGCEAARPGPLSLLLMCPAGGACTFSTSSVAAWACASTVMRSWPKSAGDTTRPHCSSPALRAGAIWHHLRPCQLGRGDRPKC